MEWIHTAFLAALAGAARSDVRQRRIPDGCWVAILLLAVLEAFVSRELTVGDRVFGALCVSLPVFLVTFARPGSFGGGDMKLLFAGGAFLGGDAILRAAVISLGAAGIYAGYLLLIKKRGRKTEFPLGPFLCVGMAVEACVRNGGFL